MSQPAPVRLAPDEKQPSPIARYFAPLNVFVIACAALPVTFLGICTAHALQWRGDGYTKSALIDWEMRGIPILIGTIIGLVFVAVFAGMADSRRVKDAALALVVWTIIGLLAGIVIDRGTLVYMT